MRTIVITGANTGIGAACAVELAGPGTHVVLACRSEDKARPVLEAIRAAGGEASFVALDLADLEKSRAAGEALAERHDAIDALVNNAGLAGQRGTTRDGFELAFGVNHLGHFAFTLPLLGALERARGRIVNVSSGNHYWPRGVPFERLREPTRSFTGLPEYGVSKLCNVLFTAELRRRYPGIESVAMHPGRIRSDIWQRRMPGPMLAVFERVVSMEPVEVGGARLAEAVKRPDTPLYIHRTEPREPNPVALREDLAAELWRFGEQALAA